MRASILLYGFWLVVILGLAAWASWFFRFEHAIGPFYLDRWRGELISPDGAWEYVDTRIPLSHVSDKARAYRCTAKDYLNGVCE